jgi:hypothetical protein
MAAWIGDVSNSPVKAPAFASFAFIISSQPHQHIKTTGNRTAYLQPLLFSSSG